MGYFFPLLFIHSKYLQIKNINYTYNLPSHYFLTLRLRLFKTPLSSLISPSHINRDQNILLTLKKRR
ncbi:hypothetical protein DJ56_748 [Yersinia pestis]|nr:hypothetical protein DJ56_748 [Yersinia pestis]KNC63846.1 hypothetical protein M485_2895 [Yersinia pestis 14735]